LMQDKRVIRNSIILISDRDLTYLLRKIANFRSGLVFTHDLIPSVG